MPAGEEWSVPDRHERWVLDCNDRRLAIRDRDVDAIVRVANALGRHLVVSFPTNVPDDLHDAIQVA